MRDLNKFVNEKLIINKNTNIDLIQPKTTEELVKIINERVGEDKNADLNDIDVSLIHDMSELFKDVDPHDIDMSGWDMSNVYSTVAMFEGCTNFTGKGLENWDVSNLEFADHMFSYCIRFNADLSKWDMHSVVDIEGMFYNCIHFNHDLSNWNIDRKKTRVHNAFYRCMCKKPQWYKI